MNPQRGEDDHFPMTLPNGVKIGSDSAPIQERSFPLMMRPPRRSIQLSLTAGSSNGNSFQHGSSTKPLEKAVEDSNI